MDIVAIMIIQSCISIYDKLFNLFLMISKI